jgi:DnaJ-class molecular chaperone
VHRKDYYAILGLSRDADDNEIRTAYRKLALLNHPDTNRDDPMAGERFKEIREAYEVLSRRVPLPLFSPFEPWRDSLEEGILSGFRCRGGGFGRVFGRRGRSSRGTAPPPSGLVADRSDPRIQDLPLSAEEASSGTERDIRLHTGRDTPVFTVSIPAGIEDGSLLSLQHPLRDGREIELLFRVRITP